MADFTTDDLNLLFEALDSWKDKDSSAELIDLMIPVLTARSKEEAELFLTERDQKNFGVRQARAAAKANRVERAIILQAKILEMRRQLEAQPD